MMAAICLSLCFETSSLELHILESILHRLVQLLSLILIFFTLLISSVSVGLSLERGNTQTVHTLYLAQFNVLDFTGTKLRCVFSVFQVILFLKIV